MAKHLLLTPAASENWRLPAGTNVDVLTTRIEEAMRSASVVRVPVVVALDEGRPIDGEVLLNGKNLLMAAIVELPG